jgi:hypothetical protein
VCNFKTDASGYLFKPTVEIAAPNITRATLVFLLFLQLPASNAAEPPKVEAENRTYNNTLTLLDNPQPLLADHPEFVEPIREVRRFEAPILVNDDNANLSVRAWRFSYNARGIIEMPNRLRAADTAVIMVHPWGIDDGQGWKTPEPAGVCDFCTLEKNHLAAKHTKTVVNPFLKSLRDDVGFVMFSLRGSRDPIRAKLYRSLFDTPDAATRKQAAKDLHGKLNSFNYRSGPLPKTLKLSKQATVKDYFRQFPGLDAGPKYNNAGFWDLPTPVTSDIDLSPEDVVIFDNDGYGPLRDFLTKHGIRHVILTGYATDMCFCKTTAGYENLSQDFNVFLVGDATLATFPANSTPRFATNAHISFAALNQLVTQISWIQLDRRVLR